jgi:hypothetical protein
MGMETAFMLEENMPKMNFANKKPPQWKICARLSGRGGRLFLAVLEHWPEGWLGSLGEDRVADGVVVQLVVEDGRALLGADQFQQLKPDLLVVAQCYKSNPLIFTPI